MLILELYVTAHLTFETSVCVCVCVCVCVHVVGCVGGMDVCVSLFQAVDTTD